MDLLRNATLYLGRWRCSLRSDCCLVLTLTSHKTKSHIHAEASCITRVSHLGAIRRNNWHLPISTSYFKPFLVFRSLLKCFPLLPIEFNDLPFPRCFISICCHQFVFCVSPPPQENVTNHPFNAYIKHFGSDQSMTANLQGLTHNVITNESNPLLSHSSAQSEHLKSLFSPWIHHKLLSTTLVFHSA